MIIFVKVVTKINTSNSYLHTNKNQLFTEILMERKHDFLNDRYIEGKDKKEFITISIDGKPHFLV